MTPFRAPRRSRLAEARYWGRVFWFPVACLLVALLALQQSAAANGANGERPLVEQAAPRTPVLSARRIPNTVALPLQANLLQGPVQQVLSQAPADGMCAQVTNARGVTVYQHNPTLPLIPASTMKLLTGYAALTQMSPTRTFGTYVATDAQLVNNTIQGNIWLIGTGDPVLATQAYARSFITQPQVYSRFDDLADQLKAAGITRIRGDVVADATRYDNTRYPSTWPARYTAGSDPVAGPVSALSVNRGFVSFPPQGQELSGSGARAASADPARDAANLLVTMLRERGIAVDGKVELGPVPQSPAFLAQLQSPPLAEIVAQMNTMSDNTIAEMLFKELGVVRAGQGTTAGGIAALTAILTEKGFATPGMVIADGSGLDPSNRVACATISGVLVASGRSSELVDGLAVAGQTGTLKDRYIATAGQGAIYAKTGSLDNVAALAGFADSATGEPVGFAVLVNAAGAEQYREVEDQLALTLMDYPRGPSVESLGPRQD